MDETRIIRGRTVIFERPDPVENLRYTIDVYDAKGNWIELLGRVAVATLPGANLFIYRSLQ